MLSSPTTLVRPISARQLVNILHRGSVFIGLDDFFTNLNDVFGSFTIFQRVQTVAQGQRLTLAVYMRCSKMSARNWAVSSFYRGRL